MPSKRESSARVDYVPALCTHRPSLLPIERFSEVLRLVRDWPPPVAVLRTEKTTELDRLEEVKVVTRFP